MKVVVIDDDELILRSMKRVLVDGGFSVETFSLPLQGIDWIRENGADIVISDIRMPEYDGFEVLKRVKKIDPDCDVIFITAHGQLETAIRALREGATDFFEKPFTPAGLTAAIEKTRRFRRLSQQKKLLSCQVNILNDEIISRTEHESV